LNGRTCELCLRNQAKYVCGKCGRAVCEFCFNSYLWLCLKCEGEQAQPIVKSSPGFDIFKFMFIGFTLIFVGILIMFIAFLLSNASGEGVILFFGPIPFILSFGRENAQTLTFSVAFISLILLIILAIFLFRRKTLINGL
jgi:uncharacterized membrane protein